MTGRKIKYLWLKNNIKSAYFFAPILNFSTLYFIFFPISLNATLVATTTNPIYGSPPYLTFDGGATKSSNTDGLLGITLSDGTSYSKDNNPSSPTTPIELPVVGQTLADVTMHVPTTANNIELDTVIKSNHFWGDDEGDGQGATGISVTGNLTLTITDSNGKTVARNEALDFCHTATYFKVVLSSTSGVLKTEYGLPDSTNFDGSTVTYYIKPKLGTPYACFAQPNMAYSGSNNPHNLTNLDGPATEWNPRKGFILQSLEDPSANFPTMGANGLFFNLTVANTLGRNITYSKSPSSSGLDLTITGSGNVAKVMLTGPKNGSSKSIAATAVPTTFTLYSDAAKTNAIYSFKINNWFIAKPGDGGGYDANYCNNSYGSNYRTPKIVDYTNANDPSIGWSNGLSGQPNNYQRRIGGGLFAEWGYLDDTSYPNADFDHHVYWAFERYNSLNQYDAYSDEGELGISTSSYSITRLVCVTP